MSNPSVPQIHQAPSTQIMTANVYQYQQTPCYYTMTGRELQQSSAQYLRKITQKHGNEKPSKPRWVQIQATGTT